MRDFHLALMILLWKCRQNSASRMYNVPGNDYTPRVIFMLRFQMDIFWYQNYKLVLSLFSCLFEKKSPFIHKFIKSSLFLVSIFYSCFFFFFGFRTFCWNLRRFVMNCLFGMLRVICLFNGHWRLCLQPRGHWSLIHWLGGLCTNKRHALISYKADSECEGVFCRNFGRKKAKC